MYRWLWRWCFMGSFSALAVANHNGDRKGVGGHSCFLHVLIQPLPHSAGTAKDFGDFFCR